MTRTTPMNSPEPATIPAPETESLTIPKVVIETGNRAPTAFGLDLRMDPVTGQLRQLACPRTGQVIVRYEAGAEVELNGRALDLRLVGREESPAEAVAWMRARVACAYGASASLLIRRTITLGGMPNRSGPPQSAHIRYEVRRAPNPETCDESDAIWRPDIEAPLFLETLTVPAAPCRWYGDRTCIRAPAIGGSGPREHVSLEDGPLSEALPYLQSDFRTAFPGQSTVNGAMYYERDSENFVWVLARRPHQGGRLEYGPQRHAYRFDWFRPLALQDEVMTPPVSFFWGRGLGEADAVLARQFDLYEEPPEWWYRTAWFWLHPLMQPGGSFETARRGAQTLMEQCGVRGFGLLAHDIPWSGGDIDVGSPRPSPSAGGADGLRRLVESIRSAGGHTFIWMSRTGHRAEDPAVRAAWALRGVDGRPIRIYPRRGNGVRLDVVNPGDPSFQEYLMEWIEYYVRQIGIDGIFWDSGFQPLPPDFGEKPYLANPGQTGPRMAECYERLYRFGRSLSRDFFMWAEGVSVDIPMNGFAVDQRDQEAGQLWMQRLAHAGPRRLVWRSCWAHDLASGFPFISPPNDVRLPATPAAYEQIALDPMNRWTCEIVRERGVRNAVGLGAGKSLLDEFVALSPGASGVARISAPRARGERLKHLHDGRVVVGRRADGDVIFEGLTSGAWVMF